MDIGGALKKDIGPLPAGVWAMAIGGGLALSYYLRGRGGGGVTVAKEEEYDGYDTEDTADYADTVWRGGQTVSPDQPAYSAPAKRTNAHWRQEAFIAVVAEGANPGLADRALGLYLSGRPLSSAERTVVDSALRLAGMPPQGVRPPRVVAPPTKPAPKPVPPRKGSKGKTATARYSPMVPAPFAKAYPAALMYSRMVALGMRNNDNLIGADNIRRALTILGHRKTELAYLGARDAHYIVSHTLGPDRQPKPPPRSVPPKKKKGSQRA